MNESPPSQQKDVSIVLCGPAGAGVQTVERLLVKLFKQAGLHLFATKEYMSRVRGGFNSITIRVSPEPVQAGVDRMDWLVPLSVGAAEHVRRRLSDQTRVLCEPGLLDESLKSLCGSCQEVPFQQIAQEIGNKLYSNIVAVGVVAALFQIELPLLEELIRTRFAKKDPTVVAENLQAVQKGYAVGQNLRSQDTMGITIAPDPAVRDRIVLSGVEAVALGAIAGGCNFIGAYPMSPSTGLLEFLAKSAGDFDIVVEQAEDEIAGINMAIGAWYAGARAVASTSGGGFALMTEGLSLAGMIESPLVVHIAQRPGPGTGLPTRTGQEDLNLALYAGHGEFPRVILAPGTLQEAFELTAYAFDLADRYQVPVFILTDQYFVDTYYDTDRFDVDGIGHERHLIETPSDYRRFELTPDGLSLRGIPGHGQGLVVVDSDEHDEAGHITEDLRLRRNMVDKRLSRMKLLEAAVIEPTLWPRSDYRRLVLCWGSTLPIVQEALTVLGRDDVSLLHFAQVFPLPPGLFEMLEQAEQVICLEGNATGQLAGMIAGYAGFNVDDCLLKYNGLQFTVEEVADSLRAIFDQETE